MVSDVMGSMWKIFEEVRSDYPPYTTKEIPSPLYKVAALDLGAVDSSARMSPCRAKSTVFRG